MNLPGFALNENLNYFYSALGLRNTWPKAF